MAIDIPTDLDYLIPDLRLHLGDTVEPYTYAESVLRHALVNACKTLMKKWRNRYIIDSSYVVSRNTTVVFEISSPPVIQYSDERAFILQASIIIKSGNLTNSANNYGSWKDDEISYSNIAAASTARGSLETDMMELDEWLRRRLFGTSKQSLGGFRLPMNQYEGSK